MKAILTLEVSGGYNGQAEAVRLYSSFVQNKWENRTVLKPEGYWPVIPEWLSAKKRGTEKVRKKYQFSKR